MNFPPAIFRLYLVKFPRLPAAEESFNHAPRQKYRPHYRYVSPAMKRKSPNAQRIPMKRQATVDWVFITGGARYRNPLTRETLAAMKPSIMRPPPRICERPRAGARGWGGGARVRWNVPR